MHLRFSANIVKLPRLLSHRKLSGAFHALTRAVTGTAMACLIGAATLTVFPADAVAEVHDDHPAWKFEWSPVAEGGTITVTITPKIEGTWSLLYWTEDNSATANDDYVPIVHPDEMWYLATFTGNGAQQNATVNTIADDVEDPDEKFYLKFYAGEKSQTYPELSASV